MNLKRTLSEDLKTVNKDFAYIFLKCLFIGVLLLASSMSFLFMWVALVVSLVFIAFERNNRSLYYIFFLFPLSAFTIQSLATFIFLALIMSVIFIKNIIQTKKCPSFLLWGTFLAVILYTFTTLNSFSPVTYIRFSVSLFLIVMIYEFREKIDYKELFFLFLLGLSTAVFLSFLYPISSHFQDILVDGWHPFGVDRFAAGQGNPNFLAVLVVFTLAMTFSLHLKQQIKLITYPIFTFLFCLMLFSGSLYGAFIFAVVTVCFLTLLFFTKGNLIKKALLPAICVLITAVICSFVFSSYASLMWDRVINSDNSDQGYCVPTDPIEIEPDKPDDTDEIEEPEQQLFPTVDVSAGFSGRIDIWRIYMTSIFSSPWTALFGNGIDSCHIMVSIIVGEHYIADTIIGTHNTPLSFLFSFGIFGLLLLIAMGVLALREAKIKIKDICLWGLFPGLAIGFYFMFEEFCFTNFIFFIPLSLFFLFSNKKMRELSESNNDEERERERVVLTVFTPTYNRAKFLPRLYESIKLQHNLNAIEWFVIDDGSIDNTSEIVKSFIKEGKININYIFQENQGKMQAHNTALDNAMGEYFVCVDSDDYLATDALEFFFSKILHKHTDSSYAGIIARKHLLNSHKNDANKTIDIQDGALLNIYTLRKKGFTGEVCVFFKTDVLFRYPFPSFENEKFCIECIVYDKMDMSFKYVYYDKAIQISEYQEDGYTNNDKLLLVKNPSGTSEYYKFLYNTRFKNPLKKVKYMALYLAFAKLAKKKNIIFKADMPLLAMFSLPLAFVYYKKLIPLTSK